MARLFLDEDVPEDLASCLRQLGHDVATVTGVGVRGESDAAQLLRAVQDGRVLIGHNGDDYDLLHQAWVLWLPALGLKPPPTHCGILIIPQQDRRHSYWLPEDAAREISRFLANRQLLNNQLYTWVRGSGWVMGR